MRDRKRVVASTMHEIHALLTLDKPGGEYYKGGWRALAHVVTSRAHPIKSKGMIQDWR